jgi:hypothetical protein
VSLVVKAVSWFAEWMDRSAITKLVFNVFVQRKKHHNSDVAKKLNPEQVYSILCGLTNG